MARPFTLDDPAAREHVFAFCRSCGHESHGGKHCWDGLLQKAQYQVYKAKYPEFALAVKGACNWFYMSSLKEHPERYRQTWENINNKLKNGTIETHIDAKFTYKKDERGSLILDSKTGQPIIDKLVGEAHHHTIHKPCSDRMEQWYIDKSDDALKNL